MDGSKLKYIQCLGCGKRIPIEDYINHTRTCQNKEYKRGSIPPTLFKEWINASPSLPSRNPDCECDICRGTKICPNSTCKTKSMYLDRKRKIWFCMKCKGYEYAHIPDNHKPFDSE